MFMIRVFILCVVWQVVTSFIEDKNEEDENHECAVYSDLTNHLNPQPCSAKHEWICKVPRGVCVCVCVCVCQCVFVSVLKREREREGLRKEKNVSIEGNERRGMRRSK